MDRLKDKVCVITGADGGICHKASEFFCAEGAKVVMVDIDPAVEAKCAEIVANGGDAIAITADVSKRETWHLILEKTLEKYGTVDCVVNGAAAFSGYKDVFNGQPDEEWEHVLDVNLNSLRFSIEVMYKWMTKNGVKGNFINFASATALSFMSSGCQAYPITKAGTKLVTQDMAAMAGRFGIRFNCLAPNLIWTPKQDAVYKNEKTAAYFNGLIPLGHYGMPEDAAWLMVYLASDEAKYINGCCIPVDGGWHTATKPMFSVSVDTVPLIWKHPDAYASGCVSIQTTCLNCCCLFGQ